MLRTRADINAFLALLLVVPAPTIGVVLLLYIAPGKIGQILSLLCYIWLLVMPLAWFLWVERRKLRLSLPKQRELLLGTVLGLLMFATILAVYWFFGQHRLDFTYFRDKARLVGISSLNVYVISALYSVLINSLLEEYVWRWFVCAKCNLLIPTRGAILLSALFFTLHHVVGLVAYINNWTIVMLASFAVFVAGVIWSWCYLTYRSIWPSYVSHALADLAIAFVGWQILFG